MLVVTAAIWGIQFPVAKHTFETVNAFHSAIFRFGVPALLLAIILIAREGWRSLQPDREVRGMLTIGILGMSGAPTLIFGGLMFTRPEIAAIVVATQPLMTVFIQSLYSGKRTSKLTLLCVLTAFLGVVTIVTRWQPLSAIDTTELAAMTAITLGALCWVVYTIACNRYHHVSNLKLTAVSMLSGASANTVIALALVSAGFISHPQMADWWQVRWELLFLAFIGVLVPMTLWNAGARRVGPLNAMLFINLIPVVTFSIQYWQGYRYGLVELIGALLVISALLVQNIAMRLSLRH